MNLRELEYIVTVARLCHFGQAAKACFVSQPTLSAQIGKLEQELGVKIFERSTRKVKVTEAGREIVRRAEQILLQARDLKETAKNLSDPLGGTINIGLIPTLGPYLLPYILPPIQQAMPALKMVPEERKTDECISALKSGELDAAIMARPIDNSSLSSIDLFHEPFYAALGMQYKVSGRWSVRMQWFIKQPVLLLQEGHCLKDQALDICNLSDEDIAVKATSLETLRNMVSVGQGVTLMPALAAGPGFNQGDNLRILPFAESSPGRDIALYFRKSSTRSELFEHLAQTIRSIDLPLNLF